MPLDNRRTSLDNGKMSADISLMSVAPRPLSAADRPLDVGAVRRLRSVRWHMAQRIVWAWIFTIPCAAGVGWLAYRVFAGLAAL